MKHRTTTSGGNAAAGICDAKAIAEDGYIYE
jgi:hypothetical protein